MSIHLSFEIEFESDYHVGAGHGDALVDSTLLRDADGVPILRGSAVTGLLRDAVWHLLQQQPLAAHRKCEQSGLGGGVPPFCDPQDNPCPICRLFGTPGHPKRWRISSARPIERLVPGSAEDRQEVGGNTVERVRVSPRMRRAEARKLFRQEYGEASWRMQFSASSPHGDVGVLEEAALLVAGARAIRGLGRARRRGAGSCRIHLQVREDEKLWLERFSAFWLEGKSLTVGDTAVPAPAPVMLPDGQLVKLRLLARAEEPLLLASRAEAGNEFATSYSIPGLALLGALASRVTPRYDLHDDASKEAFVDLFLRGRVCFSALLPARYDRHLRAVQPAIPAPLDLLTCKAFSGLSGRDVEHSAQGYALSPTIPAYCPECEQRFGDQDVPLETLAGFLTVYENPRQFSPEQRHEMHIRVDPGTGRVFEGDLYGYLELEAGQYFLGEIVCSDRAAWDALREMADLPALRTPFPLNLGRASRRGHGRVTAVLEEITDPGGASPWAGLPLEERVPGQRQEGELVLTLLTDAIVTDAWGRGQIGFDESWLGELLGGPVKIWHAFARARVIDGFFGHLGLPRFRDLALAAGSAVGLRFVGQPPAGLLDILARLERDGIGLRCAEGHGRVVFNHPLYDNRPALAENLIYLPEALQPTAFPLPAAQVFTLFRSEWGRALASHKVNNWKPDGFDAIARILREGASSPVAVLKQRLADGRFGQPSNLLGYDLKGPRSDKSLVRDTKKGRDEIAALLDGLEAHEMLSKHPGQAADLRRLGIELLADRVAQGAALGRAQRRR